MLAISHNLSPSSASAIRKRLTENLFFQRLRAGWVHFTGGINPGDWLPRNVTLALLMTGICLGWFRAFTEAAVVALLCTLPAGMSQRHRSSLFLAAVGAGIFLGARASAPAGTSITGGVAAVEAEITALPSRSGGIYRVDARVISISETASGEPTGLSAGDLVRIELFRNGSPDNRLANPRRWVRNDRIRFRGTVRVLEPRLNPGSFDRDRYLEQEGFRARITSIDPDTLTLVPGTGLLSRLDHFRSRAGRQFAAFGEGGALLSALTIGLRDEVGPVLRQQMNRQGLAHLLSISGVHFTLFAFWIVFTIESLLLFFPALVRRHPTRRIAIAVSLPVMVLYTLLTGVQTGTLRALIMFTVSALATITGRATKMFDSLMLAGAMMLAAEPRLAQDLSFHLSFLSMLGIAFVPTLREDSVRTGFLHLVKISAAVSFAATLCTAPLVMTTFHHLPLNGIIANTMLLPVIEGVLLPLGMTAAITMFFSIDLPMTTSYLVGPASDALARIISLADQIFPGPIRTGSPGSVTLMLYFAGLAIAAVAATNGRKANALVAAAGSVATLLLLSRTPAFGDKALILDGSGRNGAILLRSDEKPLWIYPGNAPPQRRQIAIVDEVLSHHAIFGEVLLLAPEIRDRPGEIFHFRGRPLRTVGPKDISGTALFTDGTRTGLLAEIGTITAVIDWSGGAWKAGTVRSWNSPAAWICLGSECRPPREFVRSGLPVAVSGKPRNRTPPHALWTRTWGQIELLPAPSGAVLRTARNGVKRRRDF